MTVTPRLRRILDGTFAVSVHLAIFAISLRYAFYKVFSTFRSWDDEGTMMLRVWELVSDPHAHDAFSGVYGPVYYLHKYAIYALLNADVSHDINRMTTVVLWGSIALACAVFVYRLSRSVVLSAIVQMQLVLHLRAFVNEPGHPHEIALILIAVALVLATFVSDRRSGLSSMLGIGAATGALLLVKVNLGAYLGAALALAVLVSMRRSAVVTILRWLAALVAVSLPAAVMWRHLELPWAWNYCALVTSTVAASVVVSARAPRVAELRWAHVGAAAVGAVLAIAAVCVVVIGVWGQSPRVIADTVLLNALDFPSLFIIPAPIDERVAVAGAISVVVALGYALVATRIVGRKVANLIVSVVKLTYGCFAFYQLHALGPGLLRMTVPIPFMWLAVVPTEAGSPDRQRFARVLVCLAAAFQTMQAYPVHGSQATWSVFLVAPVAAVCVADALRALRKLAVARWRREPEPRLPQWLSASAGALLLVVACVFYYREADLAGSSARYWQQPPLELPGSTMLRLPPAETAQIRGLVERIDANCDGFVGMPGYSSLYFWTRIRPPGSVSGTWILFMGDDQQRAIVEKMESYERPCVIQNLGLVNFWTGNQPLDAQKPLVKYMNTRFKQIDEFGGYKLLVATQASRIERKVGS